MRDLRRAPKSTISSDAGRRHNCRFSGPVCWGRRDRASHCCAIQCRRRMGGADYYRRGRLTARGQAPSTGDAVLAAPNVSSSIKALYAKRAGRRLLSIRVGSSGIAGEERTANSPGHAVDVDIGRMWAVRGVVRDRDHAHRHLPAYCRSPSLLSGLFAALVSLVLAGQRREAAEEPCSVLADHQHTAVGSQQRRERQHGRSDRRGLRAELP